MSGRGFSFCGTHSDQHGLIWVELPQEIFAVDHQIDYKSETIAGVPGAIPHGYDVKPREFRMKCGFENLSEQQRSRIGAWLRSGRYGRLIMDHRPYCYYNCMITSAVEYTDAIPQMDLRQGIYRLSGYLEFTMTAFVPYAYLLEELNLSSAAEKGMLPQVLDGTALLPNDCGPGIRGNHAYLHNAGNAYAKLNIWLEGVPGTEGIEIINHTTGRRLKITGDTAHHAYYIDALYGRVMEEKDGEMILASHVHDGDYIDLVPGCPVDRDLICHQSGNTVRISGYSAGTEDIGRYLYHGGEWSKVLDVQNGCLLVDSTKASQGGTGYMTQLNDIEVVRGTDASLEVSFDFQATFY